MFVKIEDKMINLNKIKYIGKDCVPGGSFYDNVYQLCIYFEDGDKHYIDYKSKDERDKAFSKITQIEV